MHIPDGYLSPETCAALYVTAAPFWYVALRRVKKLVSTQLLPLISVFAAFSFVIMMFNLPLPGGTTGHAVGVGIATVVLGSSASMLAISAALVIQAVFFGDGGITALGANCFNMAIVGSLVAYGVYRVVARGAGLTSLRRVIAAGLAGYAAINVSALCAAFEFGIQPMLFHDAAGTALYCPYPLSVSIPAMMIGHLTFAGLAELMVTAGIVAYLQRADPVLLAPMAPGVALRESVTSGPLVGGTFPNLKKLWIGLAVLLGLTPLGIVAVGSAWGEWSVSDFANTQSRQQLRAASGNHSPPKTAPRGLERLSSLWIAPMARYAPTFIRSSSLGYLLSAAVGVGLIWLLFFGAMKILQRGGPAKLRRGFVEYTAGALLAAMEGAAFAGELAKVKGLLQRLDSRVKVAGLSSLIVAAITVHRLTILALLFCLAVLAATASRIPIRMLFNKVWVPVLSFSGMVAIPAIFLSGGLLRYRLPLLGWPITKQGLTTAALLILRAETAVTFSTLLVFTTEWARVLRALRFFRVPVVAVVILGMTYRYIFLLLRTAHEMFESRQSRLVGTLEGGEQRRLAAGSAGVLLAKSLQLSTEVHSAMLARGFQGEVYLLDELALQSGDWLLIGLFLALATTAVMLGR